MKEFVAVNDAFILMDMALLKREALMFSRIAITHLHAILSAAGNSVDFQGMVAELDWLHEQQIVFEPELATKKQILNAEYQSHVESLRRHGKGVINQLFGLDVDELEAARIDKSRVPAVKAKLDKISDMSMDDLRVKAESKEFLDNMMLMTGYLTRISSIELRELHDLDAFTVLSGGIQDTDHVQANKGDIVEIVLNALPTPGESTSWEQIIEYRGDPDSHSKFLALRNWMNQLARAGLASLEVEQQLEFLVDEYEQHLRLHRMKTNAGTLETVIVAGAEFLENLSRFRLSKSANALFSARHRKIALIEQELTAPGRDVAYVIKTREMFS